MQKLFTFVLLAVACVASAQIKGPGAPAASIPDSDVIAKALASRNAPVCDRWGFASDCRDDQVLASWCKKTNIQANPPEMCAASDKRGPEDKILTADDLAAENDAKLAALATDKLKRARKALLVTLEIAIRDDTVRLKVCGEAKKAQGLSAEDQAALTACN